MIVVNSGFEELRNPQFGKEDWKEIVVNAILKVDN